MSAEIPDIARHWSRQTDKGKGIRLEAEAMDLLNAIGVGELILKAAAEYQRNQCQQRAARSRSISGEPSASSHGQDEITKSSGTTPPLDANEQLQRARRKPKAPRQRSTPSTSKKPGASNVAPIACAHGSRTAGGS